MDLRSLSPRLLQVSLGFLLAGGGLHSQTPSPVSAGSRVVFTAEQDHAHLLSLLGIQALRPGANPNDLKSPNAVNYDEAKAKRYSVLPAPLVFRNGKPVTTAAEWRARRVELFEDFDREVYGRVPTHMPAVTWKVVESHPETLAGREVIARSLRGHVDSSACPSIPVEIELTLILPKAAKGPVPVAMSFTFPRAMMSRFPSPKPTWQEQVIAQGWGVAELVPTSYQPDSGAGLTEGIIGLVNKGQPRKVDDWGALRAWAWGASRALDYLETEPAVDAHRVAIEGLSRYGKAALVTMAYDERFAFGFIGSSGAGGAKLHRRNFGESVENIASSSDDLPVDSHELIALCAPRPVFISCGSQKVEGQWIDQRGMFEATVAAGPVYRLLGARDLGTSVFPPQETALVSGELAWRQHEGGHTTYPNWPTFLAFANRYLKP
jgi:hypothetical protein